MTDHAVRGPRLPRLAELKFLAVGACTGTAAWFLLTGLMLSVAPIVTLPLLPRTALAARGLAAYERRRTGRYLGTAVPAPPPPEGDDIGAVLTSPGTRRDVGWLALHATLGLLTGVLAVASPAGVVQNVLTAALWPVLPSATTTLDQPVRSWGDAGLALATAAGYGLAGAFLVPPMARWYARLSAARLAPRRATLVERLAEVTATRAAALEAHGTELRRIERSLHDGTQNRIVAVVMHLGMVERALLRDPQSALPMIRTAQDAAGDALSELREVVRQIYPPVLTDRGLRGAVAALAAHCAIPCALEAAEELPRAPAAVEAAAYFVVAEALTNAVKHSGARQITVSLRTEGDRLTVEVTDDGHGGADGTSGSGVVGIQRRVAAFDGTTRLHSPPGGPTVLRADIPLGV
ncbi:sensor histidine kinase [Streptomyces corynorhini]|uniref:sensor histidine kinase n=1 Tax=Streptomyces corynorhini TaxID=2282652 RepID=UPI0013146206|nr:sensor domain-containing protein [Streptomyces corynorhini]